MAATVDFKEGMRVRVMNRTAGGKDIEEGTATIIKINQGDRQGIHAQVQFDDEATLYGRWIYAQYQDPIGYELEIDDMSDTLLEKPTH